MDLRGKKPDRAPSLKAERTATPSAATSGRPEDGVGADGLYRTKSQGVFEELRRWILIGRLEPGQRLDQEWLARELRVSRMPLRQALLKLEADGLIESQPHRGAIVTPLSLSLIEDIYFSRNALESMLAEAGSSRGDEALWAKMAGSIEEQERAIASEDIERYVELDRSFHMLLYRASGYNRSCDLVERLRDVSDRYVRFFARYRSGASKSIQEHQHILQACRDGAVLEVRRLTEEHIMGGLQTLRIMIREEHLSARDRARTPA